MDKDELVEESLEPTNEIVEITDETEQTETVYDMEKIENENNKKKKNGKSLKNRKSLKDKWNELSKKQKRIIIVCAIIVLLIIIGLLLYFLVFKHEKEIEKLEPEVILEKGNYRYEDGILIFLDQSKNELGRYECQNKDEKKCYVASYSGEDEFDVVRRVYQNNKGIEEGSDIFNNNFVFIYDNPTKVGNLKLYNIKEQKAEDSYILVKKVNDDSVIVQNEKEQYGMLTLKDSVTKTIDFKYDYLGKIVDKENLVALTGSSSKIIGLDGNDISKSAKGNIKNYNEKYISYENNGKYVLYNYDGKVVLDNNSDFITFKDDYIFTILNRKLYAYDSSLTMLNYEGISLNNDNYVKTIIFNDELKEINRKETFDIQVGSSTIAIKQDENVKEINVYEGKLNKNYKYVSYFDGVLYIFTDKEKAHLLGSYTCKNKNVVTSNSTMYENCFVASETKLLNRSKSNDEIGYLPVINNRFVFVNDVENVKDNDIFLLERKSNGFTKRGEYTEVDAGYYSNDFDFIDAASLIIMAKDKNDNYGLIKLEKTSASFLIRFNETDDYNVGGATKEIRYQGNDFLVKRNDKYVLYTNTGELIGYATGEIIKYNDSALLVKNGDAYTVTTKDGQLMKSDLVYVRLLKNVFVGVSRDNTVNVYAYIAPTKDQSNNGLITLEENETLPKINSTNYENDIYVNEEKQTISIEGGIPRSYALNPATTGEVNEN